ncbi:MAG: hypothetical protein ACYC8V_09965 [Caulobacteraceae bacterium]
MVDSTSAPDASPATKVRLPWFVTVSPEYSDDPYDTGYGWAGWAVDADDAVAQALEKCHRINDRDAEDRDEDLDPERARVVEIDFHRLAGPLVHWARTTGGWDTPLWKAMEAAVAASDLPVGPLDLSEAG